MLAKPSAMETFVKEVFLCKHCERLRVPFVDCQTAGRSFRFPPIIGATENARLLFVGINPRVTDSNRHLHEDLMHDYPAFLELSQNRFRGHRYVAVRGLESHYSAHVRIANQVFPGQHFDEMAAVTELFFCASESSKGLPVKASPCANIYFERVLTLIRPRIVFAVGVQVARYLAKRYGSEDGNTLVKWGHANQAPMIAIPHPNSRGEKLSKWSAAAEAARAHLHLH